MGGRKGKEIGGKEGERAAVWCFNAATAHTLLLLTSTTFSCLTDSLAKGTTPTAAPLAVTFLHFTVALFIFFWFFSLFSLSWSLSAGRHHLLACTHHHNYHSLLFCSDDDSIFYYYSECHAEMVVLMVVMVMAARQRCNE